MKYILLEYLSTICFSSVHGLKYYFIINSTTDFTNRGRTYKFLWSFNSIYHEYMYMYDFCGYRSFDNICLWYLTNWSITRLEKALDA